MAGKGTAGVGILIAAALVVWAVANPGPERPETTTNGANSPGSTAFRLAGGAALGGQAEVATIAAPAPEEAAQSIEEILAQFLEESGLSADQEAVRNLVGRFNSIANQAQGLLRSASAQLQSGGLNPGGATPQVDAARLAQLLNDPRVRSAVESRVGSQRLARANQLTGASSNTQAPPPPAIPSGGLPGISGSSSLTSTEDGGFDPKLVNPSGNGGFLEDDFFKNVVGPQKTPFFGKD